MASQSTGSFSCLSSMKTAGYWALSIASQKVMKTTLRSVKIFIIDEVSMVSSLNLAHMHLRLEEPFGSNDWFGSKIMLDLLQLQPVNGHPVFENITQKSLQHILGCATSTTSSPLISIKRCQVFSNIGFGMLWLSNC